MRMHQNNNLLLIFCLFFWRARECWCTTNLATHVLYLAAHLPKLAAHLPNLADHHSNLAPNLPSFTYNQRWKTKQIRKFLCLFRYRKFANFLGVPVRQIANPQIFITNLQNANLQISTKYVLHNSVSKQFLLC